MEPEPPPCLMLIMVNGPRSGETLEYQPGSTIRIGRIVRGNNVPIKDSGISTKHLIIRSESGKWTIEDLDSSNGTVLNSTKLLPNTPVDLHNDDTVAIGEYTTIQVKLTIDAEDNQPYVRMTRQAARKNEEEMITRKDRGRRMRRNLQEMPLRESSQVEEELKSGEVEKSGVKEISCDNKVEKVTDLKKMTLGDWFDYMEVLLPKRITEETEEIIEGMRKKSDRVLEYRLQQRKKKQCGEQF